MIHDDERKNGYDNGFDEGWKKGWQSREDEIVKCKDCKHRDPEDKKCDCGHDIHWQLPRPDNWFCADGEKRD